MSSRVITSARISGVTVAVSVIIGVPGGTRARNSCRRANDGLNFGLLFVCAWTLRPCKVNIWFLVPARV